MDIHLRFKVGDMVWVFSAEGAVQVEVESISVRIDDEVSITYRFHTFNLDNAYRSANKVFATREELINSLK